MFRGKITFDVLLGQQFKFSLWISKSMRPNWGGDWPFLAFMKEQFFKFMIS